MHRSPAHPRVAPLRSRLASIAALALATAALLLPAVSASAHGFTSTVYADLTSGTGADVRAELELEYDLLVVSTAEYEKDDVFFEDGMAAFQTGDELVPLTAHIDSVVEYVTGRFTVTRAGASCTPELDGDPTMIERQGVPYAHLVLTYACAGDPAEDDAEHPVGHQVGSTLFGDDEGYVTGTETIVTYDIDDATGSSALDAGTPTFSTGQTTAQSAGEFFLLGAEHLLSGIDHILFLLALIVGSRRLRDVVLAATTFTVAHSVTFILAALGVVSISAVVVEPIIALSIAVVAAWYLVRLRWRRAHPDAVVTGGWLGLTRSDVARLAVVFLFGLIHGLGFASALGIQEAFSWTLLGSLLVFNVGIEAVQVGIILIVFPLLALLRRRAPRVGLWTGIVVAGGVALVGLIWFVQRVLGLG